MSGPDEPDELEPLIGLPPDDPRVRAAPPAVRARLRAYRDFVAPGDTPDGARVAEAEQVMEETLARELGLAPADSHPARPATAAPGGARPPGRWWALGGPRMRLAFAALVVVVSGIWLAWRTPDEPVMRGPRDPARAGELAAGVRTLAGDVVRLEWDRAPEAVSYTVVFLAPDLTEVARVPDLQDTHLALRRGALPAGLDAGDRLLWRVLAMHGPDEVARSAAMPVTVP